MDDAFGFDFGVNALPSCSSSSTVVAKPKWSLRRFVHGRNGRTRKRKAGRPRQGLTSRRVAPPCRPAASLPCFPFFPWSNRLPSCPAAGRGQTPARRGGQHTRPRKLPIFEHLTPSREAAKGNANIGLRRCPYCTESETPFLLRQ